MANEKVRFVVLNVLSLRPLLAGLPIAQPGYYGAETVAVRRLRRELRWTPVTAMSL